MAKSRAEVLESLKGIFSGKESPKKGGQRPAKDAFPRPKSSVVAVDDEEEEDEDELEESEVEDEEEEAEDSEDTEAEAEDYESDDDDSDDLDDDQYEEEEEDEEEEDVDTSPVEDLLDRVESLLDFVAEHHAALKSYLDHLKVS